MIWKLIAKIVSIPDIADYLIKRSMKTPYIHLDGYMNRYWLFNGYKINWLPSIRIHHILREDRGDHMHDHPWDARTIILHGVYVEEMEGNYSAIRKPGDTRAIKYGEYHHIRHVQTGGVWTIFITWKYCGVWGFLVNGKKVPHYEYKDKEKR